MTPADGDCPLARAMRETLDAVVTPVVREALIHDALILAGLPVLPMRRDAMRTFAGEHLRAVVARALGAEMAASITDEILFTIGRSSAAPPSTHRAQSHRAAPRAPASRRPHTPAPATRRTPVVQSSRAPVPASFRRTATPLVTAFERSPTEPPPPWPAGTGSHIRGGVERDLSRALRDTDPAGDPSHHLRSLHRPPSLPFVFVATLDGSLFDALTRACDGRARLSLVRTPAELVKRLEGLEGRPSLVILDGEAPSIRPAALAILLEDAPEVRVVFCRADRSAGEFVRQVSPSTRDWSVYAEPSIERVAAECIRLVS
jgi:hypothetical protein